MVPMLLLVERYTTRDELYTVESIRVTVIRHKIQRRIIAQYFSKENTQYRSLKKINLYYLIQSFVMFKLRSSIGETGGQKSRRLILL